VRPIVVAISGASGAIYGRRLVESALQAGASVELIVTDPARRVARDELGVDWSEEDLARWLGARRALVRVHEAGDIGATVASGSHPVQGMIVAPCSMGSAGRIAAGLSDGLLERAADVQLKERRPLVLVVRETPLSAIHLENLLRLARAGATILPAAPGFYGRPRVIAELVDFVVERALAAVAVEGERTVQWRGEAPA
jgi:4-hydroxy-3-polyprenylbenzoate decarboxylase